YRLPELIASEGEIYVCEGEKDVDRLVGLGFTATTCPMGAGKWRDEYSEWLKDRDVVIIPDNDPIGREHAGKIACALHGLAKSIKIVSLPGLSEHGDVSDFLDQNTKENLLTEVKKATLYESATSLLERLETWNQIGAMDIKVEWLVDRLIPKGAITVLFGQGGVGKTWLMMDAALNIGNGSPFLNLKTLKTPVVFVDFENPLVTLNTRIKKLGEAENVFFWRSGNSECRAPKLDSEGWDQYKLLPKDCLLIFDTLRASQSGDENASDRMAVIMNQLKELRDLGMTIVVLHHTSKNQNKLAKGSTAIVDLCDHVLGLWAVKNQEDDTAVEEDEIDEETVYRFGWKDKTRFEPYEVHLILNPDRGFELAPDPEEKSLLEMQEYLEEHGPLKKTDFAKGVNKHLGIPEKKARKLIGRGDGRYWKIEGAGANNTKMVSIIRLGSLAPPIGPAKPPNRIETLEPQLNKGIYSETI
ncbi:MAG: AAA family ATPase, partial [Nitrospirota bacterium]|nr:AAA family ATPase [Nitrospirota bacterium]